MRVEATLAQWKELYEVAIKVKSLQPWKYFWDMDIFTILLPNEEEPFFCSIMGKGGTCFAIGTYVGFDDIAGFYQIADQKDIPSHQLIRYQNNLMCYFGNREELTKKELQLIKDLGLSFRGKNEWIYFHSFKTGYAPYMLDKEQVLILTEVLKQLFMALRAIVEKGLKVEFERGYTLLRKYNSKTKLWECMETPNYIPPKELKKIVLQDELLLARLKSQKLVNNEIEIDTLYLNATINDKSFDRPVLPKLCVLADHNSMNLLDKDMLSPEDDDVQVILGQVINYIMNVGKPKRIYVRDELIESILFDLCERTGIKLKVKGSLKAIDYFAEAFINRGF